MANLDKVAVIKQIPAAVLAAVWFSFKKKYTWNYSEKTPWFEKW